MSMNTTGKESNPKKCSGERSKTMIFHGKGKEILSTKCEWCDGTGETLSGFVCQCKYKK